MPHVRVVPYTSSDTVLVNLPIQSQMSYHFDDSRTLQYTSILR